jgi:phage shock protein PspC (stress-responsive transcriptional regulator)
MKETTKASIAGISFVLDNDAYAKLEEYLGKLEKVYGTSPEGREITGDIEARIVELILERQSAEQVVSAPLVEEIVAKLGMPDKEATEGEEPPKQPEELFPRRLYRDMERSKIGGVCSGLAAFFDTDAVWFRLGIFSPLLLLIILAPFDLYNFQRFLGVVFAMFVLLYFILWFAIPAARTPRQKLEMAGRRITAASIGNKAAAANATSRPANVTSELFTLLGRILIVIIKAIVILAGIGIAIFLLALLARFITIAFMASSDMGFGCWSVPPYIDMSPRTFISLGVALAVIPAVMLLIWIISFIFGKRFSRTVMWILGCAWLVIAAYMGTEIARGYSEPIDVTGMEESFDDLPAPVADSLNMAEPVTDRPDATEVVPPVTDTLQTVTDSINR